MPGLKNAVREEGIAFLGPTAEQIEVFGLKHSARDLAASNSVPMLAGSDLLADLAAAIAFAQDIGFPLMLKAPPVVAVLVCVSVTTKLN